MVHYDFKFIVFTTHTDSKNNFSTTNIINILTFSLCINIDNQHFTNLQFTKAPYGTLPTTSHVVYSNYLFFY
jgi:hypothetical protein